MLSAHHGSSDQAPVSTVANAVVLAKSVSVICPDTTVPSSRVTPSNSDVIGTDPFPGNGYFPPAGGI